MSDAKVQAPKPAKRRRWVRVTICVILVGAIFVALLPWIITATPLCNALANQAVAPLDLRVKIGKASFGWFSPLMVGQLSVDHVKDESAFSVSQIEAEKSWLQLLMSAPDLGTIEIDQPQVELILAGDTKLTPPATEHPDSPPSEDPPSEASDAKATLTAAVTDAAVVIRTADRTEPAINMSGLNVTARVQQGRMGRELIIDPTTLFDHLKLTPELCRGGLQLVAPALADSTDVDGEISFQLDRFFVPLDDEDKDRAAQRAEIEGVLTLHQVTGSLRNPAIDQVLGVVSRILNREIPRTVQMVDNTELAFQLREGRFHHEGLAFMLPGMSHDFVLQTSGSVGFDESLDLLIKITIPLTMVHDGPLSRKLSEQPFVLHVTGTFEEPHVDFPENRDWLHDLADVFLSDEKIGEQEQPLADALSNVVGGLLEEGQDREGPRPTPILDRIQAAQQARAERRADSETDGGAGETPILDVLRGARPRKADDEAADTETDRAAPILERIRGRRQRSSEGDEEAGGDAPTRPRPVLDRLRSQRQQTEDDPPEPPSEDSADSGTRRGLFRRRR